MATEDQRRPGPGAARTQQAKNPMLFMGVIAVLCAAGWFLVQWMSDSTRTEDCIRSGRKNCVPVDPALGR
jgi:hypothetical protein